MKTNNDSLTVVERDGIASDGAFRIEFNAKMANILSKSLYSDPIGSVVRELCCNAIDSHIEAGINRPIEVHLPNQFDSFFYVEDFGVGLDSKQVEDIYTVYGTSTKTNSNKFVGQLGLGSKSPFSYVDAFDVTVRKNGKEWQYSMYKSEDGMPKAALLGEQSTTESNGVMVKMPVKKGDTNRFHERAQDIFKWFDIKPKVLGAANFTIPSIDIEYKGNGWRIRKAKHSTRHYEGNVKPVALMGKVAYPLDVRNIPNVKPSHVSACELPIILDFEIGELEVAASRESLSYDPRTQKNVLDRIDRLLTELGSNFDNTIATAKTEWEARIAFGDIFSGNDFGYELKNIYSKHGFKWRSKVITSAQIDLNYKDIWDSNDNRPPVYNVNSHRNRAQSIYSYGHNLSIACDNNAYIIFDDLDRGGVSRACYYRDTLNEDKTLKKEKSILLIGPSKLKTVEQIAHRIGDPPYILTSSLPKKPSKKSERIKVLRFTEFQRTKTSSWSSVDIDIDTGGIYVLLDGYTPVRIINKVKTEIYNIGDLLTKAKKIGLLNNNQIIYAPRSEFRKKFIEHDKWEEFTDKLAKEITKLLTPIMLQEIADLKEYQKCLSDYRSSGIWGFPAKIDTLDKDGSYYKIAIGMMSLERTAKKLNNEKYQAMVDIAKWLGTEIKVVNASLDTAQSFREFDLRYPLIKMSGSKYSGADINKDNIDAYLDYVKMCDERFKRRIHKV